jgi:hypothetical protein
MMNIFKSFSMLLTALLVASVIPTPAMAGPIEITASIKSSLDKTVANASRTQADKINTLYNELQALQTQEQEWDVKIKALHAANKETSTALRKQIKQIDEAKLDQLEADLTSTRERYKSLFSLYSSLNKQIDTARLQKNKALTAALRFQASLLKIPVKLGHMDIAAKESARKTAKSSATQSMKKIRGTLDDIDPINVQIKAKQDAIKTIEAGVSPVWKAFKQVVKKEETTSVLDTLASMVSLSRQINEEHQKVFDLETKVSGILSTAKEQIVVTTS